MNKYIKSIIFCLFCILRLSAVQAQTQKTDTINVGTVTGMLRDSVHNYILESATLAIYKAKDNELVSYQLTNAFGRYQFKQIPVNVGLRIVITHVGYQSVKKEFAISPKTKSIDLKTINLQRIDFSLKEVVITAAQAPMQMHGDTLEFNASAFKLDSNAVVGDLLRKLTGVTVWPDGSITVNGKKISRLLVEGKTFLSGDNRVVLDNIAKDAVQKVQVYRNKDDKDPVNPETDMNIVFKKNKKDGLFGKFGLGYGTNQLYAGDGMVTYYSPKTQFSASGTYNNVNKTADGVDALMAFNSFKGDGINDDYHSDFTKSGVNAFKGGGATFSQDFSKDSDPRRPDFKTNLLKGEIFTSDAANKVISHSQTYISFGSAGTQNQITDQTYSSDNYTLRSRASYAKKLEHAYLSISLYSNESNSTSENNQKTTTSNDQSVDKSQDEEKQKSKKKFTTVEGNLSLNTSRYSNFSSFERKSLNTELKYNFNVDQGNDDNKTTTDFKATDVSQNRYINRQYLKNWSGSTHTFLTRLKDITGLISRGNQFLQIDLLNEIHFNNHNETDGVSDLPTGATIYIPNIALTNVSHYKTVDENPAIVFLKTFNKYLDNRFNKVWQISMTAQERVYFQKNTALQAIQNLERSYYYFVPHAEISYLNEQYGDFSKSYRLTYYTKVTYPGIDQLAPLVDDANIYSKTIVNLSLKPAYKHSLALIYSYYDQKNKNPITYNLVLSGEVVKNNIVDSISYDDLARTVNKYINTSDSRTFDFNNTIKKAYIFKDNQFQFTGSSRVNYSEYSSNVNGSNYLTQSTTLTGSGNLTYTYKSIWTVIAGEDFSGSKNHQGSLSRYTNHNWKTNFGLAFAFPKSIFFNTRVNINNNKTSAVDHNIYYTIWNADLGYRFLRGAQGEIKLSALDILHQNKSLQNYIGLNHLTTTTTNVLQQYFMLTLAYYPRSFGLHKKKE
jgi:hypothetical protein